MIIPGKKRPAGIQTPYVVIVKINQIAPKANILSVSKLLSILAENND